MEKLLCEKDLEFITMYSFESEEKSLYDDRFFGFTEINGAGRMQRDRVYRTVFSEAEDLYRN